MAEPTKTDLSPTDEDWIKQPDKYVPSPARSERLNQSAVEKKKKIIWQHLTDTRIAPMARQLLKEFHALEAVRIRAEAKLDRIAEDNPMLFFQAGFQHVPDGAFDDEKRPFSYWTPKATISLIAKEPVAFMNMGTNGLGMHLDREYTEYLPLLFESLKAKLGAKDGKEFKKAAPELFPKIKQLVELLSIKHPNYYVRHCSTDPAFVKYWENIGVKAYTLYTLVKLANHLDSIGQTELASQIDHIIGA